MKYILALFFALSFLLPIGALAAPEDQPSTSSSHEVKAQVIKILEDKNDGLHSTKFLAKGADGNEYSVDSIDSYTDGLPYTIQAGQSVYLQIVENTDATRQIYLVDVVRTGKLLAIFVFFAVLVAVVGYWRGLSALLGLGITMTILFAFIAPRILAGMDPVLATVIGSIGILAVNMHLSHGFNRRTFIAYFSTVIGLGLSVLFAYAFVYFAQLSGFASDEVTLLFVQTNHAQVPVGILLAGIILGATGVLDDITITQSETVTELIDANPDLSRAELFRRAMRVGRHHIASTVNTLVLAYAGVALPLILLFMFTHVVSPMRFLNDEVIAEEFVRTIAGTAALVLVVPISTWLATFQQGKNGGHGHKHGHQH